MCELLLSAILDDTKAPLWTSSTSYPTTPSTTWVFGQKRDFAMLLALGGGYKWAGAGQCEIGVNED